MLFSNFIEFLLNPVRLAFKHADASKNKMFLAGIRNGTGLIDVTQVHIGDLPITNENGPPEGSP